MDTLTYKIFGLTIKSDLVIIGLNAIESQHHDVKIVIGKNPASLPQISKRGILYESYLNDFLFKLENVGSYRVQNGCEITVDPIKPASVSEVSLFLLGPVIGALLHQRGILALHGSSIVIDKKVTIILGHSAAGKSSLAAAFEKDGYSILSDDISAISDYNHEEFVVLPGIPYLKLWPDVINYLNISDNLQRTRPGIQRYLKPLNQSYCCEDYNLEQIICLEIKNISKINYKTTSGTEKFRLLHEHTYRNQYIKGLGKSRAHFLQICDLASHIPVHKIARPESPLDINKLKRFIQEELMA